MSFKIKDSKSNSKDKKYEDSGDAITKIKTFQGIIDYFDFTETISDSFDPIKKRNEHLWQTEAAVLWSTNAVGHFVRDIEKHQKIGRESVLFQLAVLYKNVIGIHGDIESAIDEAGEVVDHIYGHIQESIEDTVNSKNALEAAVIIANLVLSEVLDHTGVDPESEIL